MIDTTPPPSGSIDGTKDSPAGQTTNLPAVDSDESNVNENKSMIDSSSSSSVTLNVGIISALVYAMYFIGW